MVGRVGDRRREIGQSEVKPHLEPRLALARAEEAEDHARERRDARAEVSALVAQGRAASDLADYEVAEARLYRAAEHAGRIEDSLCEGEALVFLGDLACRRGELDEAEQAGRRGQELAGAHGSLLGAHALGLLGRVALSRREGAHAASIFARGAVLARRAQVPCLHARMLLGLAVCAHVTDDHAGAQTHLVQVRAIARRHTDSVSVAEANRMLGVLARDHGDLDGAGRMCAEALQLCAENGTALVPALAVIAGIALDRGDYIAAARLFAATAQVGGKHRHYPAVWLWEAPWHARDLERLGEALDAGALRKAWRQGSDWSSEDVVDCALRQVGGRRRRAGSRPGRLTDTEREVARLVAQGLRNKEVAPRLNMAVRTVSCHLTHVYEKLGIASRHDLRGMQL